MPDNKKHIKKTSFLASIGMPARRWAKEYLAPAKEIKEADSYLYGAGHTTIASLLGGSGRRAARARQLIYNRWEVMESDAIVSSALLLLITSALGGHETSGDVVFIEQTPATEGNQRLTEIVEDLKTQVGPLFNKNAFQSAYTATVFGDSYARIYSEKGLGVVDMYVDELVRPQIVQAYERGSRTVGYAVYVGDRAFERLDPSQMARLRMPRTQWVPQHGVVEKALRIAITEDDVNKLPIMPAMAGGSLLYNAEESYDNLYASLLGLVSHRWADSIDEQMLSVNLESMTKEQQKQFVGSIKSMLTASKDRADAAVEDGRPVLERIRHIIPTFGDKQLTTVGNMDGGQSGRTSSITIEDVILHARLLSGAIGVDLSMLGFADQLSGGLGDGGFFRVSAQAAERARTIRTALTDYFNQIINIHTYKKYGIVFNAEERPWAINFYGSISALEAEKQRTRADSMNAGMMLAQAMQQMKDAGATEDIMIDYLTKSMMLDEDQAKLYAAIVKVKDDDSNDEMNHEPPSKNDELDSIGHDYDNGEDGHCLFDGIGQASSIPVPQKTIKWLGFEGSMSLRADLHALAERHDEIYSGDPDQVLDDIQFVIKKPDDWFIHHGNRISIFRERIGGGEIPLVRVEFEVDIRGGSLVAIARSVYTSKKRQISKKMQEKKRILARLGPGEKRPGLLSVAEYLSILGNRS